MIPKKAMDMKTRIRSRLLAVRSGLSETAVGEASGQIAARVRALEAWQHAREVLLYWPIRGEVDVRPLMRELWSRGARVLLPRCRPEEQGLMDLACVSCEADLTPGMYSIMEPSAGCMMVESPSPQVALIPGVAFDRRGFRLGFGAGYYDRLLAMDSMVKCLSIGMCYDFQLVDNVPGDEWDMPMQAVATQGEMIWCA